MPGKERPNAAKRSSRVVKGNPGAARPKPAAGKRGQSTFRGTSLRPVPPGESKHKEVRYFDIREHEPLDDKQMAAWIRQASALPGWVP